jgi:hypothetical protein
VRMLSERAGGAHDDGRKRRTVSMTSRRSRRSRASASGRDGASPAPRPSTTRSRVQRDSHRARVRHRRPGGDRG